MAIKSLGILQQGFLPWLEWLSWWSPIDRKVPGLISHQGTYPGCGFDSCLGRVPEGNQSMFLSLSKEMKKMYSGKDILKKKKEK